MDTFLKYFKGSTIFTIVCLVLAYFIGGVNAVFITAMLAILETSLSFDNAVVNAKVLEKMSLWWRKIFLTVGMIIAVFGMRIVFPFVIVAFIAGDSLSGTNIFSDIWQAGLLAINDKEQFKNVLISSHALIAGFGGAFLLMVTTKFFLDDEKHEHWIPILEKPLTFFGKIEAVQVMITLTVAIIMAPFVHDKGFFISCIYGIIVYIIADGIGSILEGSNEESEVESEKPKTNNTIKSFLSGGLGSFIYLEILDASFSFDGVIGAFAVTNDIFIIALGLGIGAMFVRSLTILMVEKKSLSEYKYLEPAAFYAIAALTAIMFISATGIEVPEVVSGLIGLLFIGAGFIHSLIEKKKSN